MSTESTLQVEGMTCSGCVGSVTRVLQALPGVDSVEVSLERGEARLRYDAARVGRDDFRRVVEEAGFTLR